MWILIVLLLLSGSPVYAIPYTLQLTGLMADGGTIAGSLQYDPEAAPTGINIRNLSGSASYPLSNYAVTVAPVYGSLAPVLYHPILGQSSELCLGHCLFGSTDVNLLRFSDGLHSLQLAFQPQWASLLSNASDYRSPQANGIDQVTIVVRSADVTSVSVPEPATWILLLMGAGIGLILSIRSKLKVGILAVAILWGLILTSEPALAGCTYQQITVDGVTRMCTTCCFSGNCNTTCT